MTQKFINNYSTTVAQTFGSGDTYLRVASPVGLPVLGVGEYFLLTVFRKVGQNESGHEVIKVTEVVSDQLTAQRSIEGAAASTFIVGDRVEARLTAGSLDSFTDAAQAAAAAPVQADDSRLTDSRSPTGNAGGVLSGTYPNPGFAVDMATQGELDAVATAAAAKLSDAPSNGKTYGRKDAAWAEVVSGGGGDLIRSARTSNTILGTADKGKLIDITSGTFSQTFSAVATLGAGWWCYLRNSGTGDITLDPSGAELIDGLSTFVVYPGETRLLQCDGLTLRSVVMQPFSKTFTASGTFVKPPGYTVFDSLIWSGGNSGQKSDGAGAALGGGGGGCFPAKIPASLLSSSTAITVGAGGAARTTTADGALGGGSSIGTLVTVKQATNSHTYGGAVMVGSEAVLATGMSIAADFSAISSAPGGAIYGGGASTAASPSAGSIYGGGAGGSYYGGSLYAPGASSFGGSGGAAGGATNGVNGTAPGGGGGGTNTGTQSGAGARGEVRIWGAM